MSISRLPRAGSLVSLAVPFALLGAVAFVRCSSRPSDEWSAQSATTARTFTDQVDVGQALFAKHCDDCHGRTARAQGAAARPG